MTAQAQQDQAVPEGYWKNSRGHLIPAEHVSEMDKEKDRLVRELVSEAEALSRQIAEFKHRAMSDVEAFAELAAERYDVKLGGKKGNIQLTTYDGAYQAELSVADRIYFDEKIQAAKAIVDECIHSWTEGSRSEIKALVEQAFQVDRQGNLNTSRILELLRLDIQDERWRQGMEALKDSMQVAGTVEYLRIRERHGRGWRQIPLSITAL